MVDDIKNPVLSIIVPVYNEEKYLKRCIDSILNQKFSNYELILINDGSTDGSGDICDEYQLADNRVRVIHKENGGLSSARNYGLQIAVGKYIGFVDSDDWITADMYSFLIETAIDSEADIVASSYILTKGEERFRKEEQSIICLEGRDKIKFYLESGMKYRVSDYPVWNKVYKKKLFEELQFPEGQLYEDAVINYRLIKKSNKFVKSNKTTYFYFQDNDSITRNGFKEEDYDILLVGKQLVELAVEEEDEELLRLAQTKEARAYFSMLSKIAVYGFQDDVENRKKIIEDLTNNLRKNYKLLLKSRMPINRKIIMTFLYININIVRLPAKLLNSFF